MVGSLYPVKDDTKVTDRQTNVGAQVTELSEDEAEVTSICCLQGCLTACTIVSLFFLVLPAGILVTVYSSNNDDQELMAAGISLMVLPLIALPIVIALVLNRRRLKRLRKIKVSSTPDRQSSQQKY